MTTQAAITIEKGYRPGVIGRAIEMQARCYAHQAGFGLVFEARIAGAMAEFAGRLDDARNALWLALSGDTIIGTIAIDGQDLGPGLAHLRWFIVEDGYRGSGLGRALLSTALAFCDAGDAAETHLWTFQGLDAARRLYESQGFVLAEEFAGRQWGREVIEQRFVRRSARRGGG